MPISFFSLPAEIRTTIYHLLVHTPTPILLSKPQPALAKVNRQLHNEVLAAYYSRNTFVLPLATRRLEKHLLRFRFLSEPEVCVLRSLRCIDVFVERGWLVGGKVREKEALGLLCLRIRIWAEGEGFEVLSGRGEGIEEAVGRVMRRDEGVYTGLSLLRFALEMRPSLQGKARH